MIDITVNSSGALVAIAQATNQLPYAMSLALNRLANLGQEAERQQMRQGFKLRREQFVVRGVKIEKADRATKTSWRVVIQMAYPDNRHFMDQHEEGGFRTRTNGRFLWQPNSEVFKSKVISASNPLAPKNLHMARTPGGQVKGENGTFMVKTGAGQRLVLQRVTKAGRRAGGNSKSKQNSRMKKGSSTRVLYRLVDRVRIPADLKFVATIGREVAARQAEIMDQALREAIRTARL